MLITTVNGGKGDDDGDNVNDADDDDDVRNNDDFKIFYFKLIQFIAVYMKHK